MDALKQVLGQTPASKDAILAAQKVLDEAVTLQDHRRRAHQKPRRGGGG